MPLLTRPPGEEAYGGKPHWRGRPSCQSEVTPQQLSLIPPARFHSGGDRRGDAHGGADKCPSTGSLCSLAGERTAKALYTVRENLRAPSVPPCSVLFVCPLAIPCRTGTYDLSSTTPVLFSTFLSADSTCKWLSFSRKTNRKAHFCKQNVNDWKNCTNFSLTVCD